MTPLKSRAFLPPCPPGQLTPRAPQEDCDDEEDWNPSKAAGVSLMLLAACVEDDIVPHVLPFVTQHIKAADWKFRDAALMAFGERRDGRPGSGEDSLATD